MSAQRRDTEPVDISLESPVDGAAPRALGAIVDKQRIVVCVGSGGVGKTTTAAALALLGAARGRRTLVITIDPARRLADALGLRALSHAPQRVDDDVLSAAGLHAHAPLSAMMLDLQAAWDDMLFRTAPDRETALRIQQNRFYDVLSRELPGAHEFIACECLHHLTQSGQWDLVVLDTPPTQNALDFLDAPQRVLGLLDNDAFRFFAHRRDGLGMRFLDGATGRAQGMIAKFTGEKMLEELSDFLLLLRDLYDPLTTRAKEFVALLSGPETRFVVVTAPQPTALSEAGFFLQELQQRKHATGALVVNRMTRPPRAALESLAHARWEDAVGHGLDDDTAARLVAALDTAVRQQARLADAEGREIEALVQRAGRVPVVRVPRLDDAVHDARGLLELLPWLVGPSGVPALLAPR